MRIPPTLRRESVTVTPFKGEGAYGPVYGDPVVYAPPYKGVYVEPGNRQAVDADGRETIANAVVFFDGDVTASPGDFVEWQGRHYIVVDAQPMRPFGRTNHVEVLIRSTEEVPYE